jgi:hypothetical protein
MWFRARLSLNGWKPPSARYHANAITTVQVLEELIRLAKDIRAARERGEETGLNDEEIAFYDALAENEGAREVMGEPQLRVMAHELMTSIRGNVTVDWMHREAARAKMRVIVKRILRKYGFPPDLQDAAVQTVLQPRLRRFRQSGPLRERSSTLEYVSQRVIFAPLRKGVIFRGNWR